MEEQLTLFGEPEPIELNRKQTISSIVEYLQNRSAPDPRSPIVVSYGGGVDSTAMLIAMHLKGIKPDLIVFSDTGDEKAETYAYIKMFTRWLRSVGFPPITRTRYRIQKVGERKKLLAYYHSRSWKSLQLAALEAFVVAYQNVRQVVKYDTLMEKCIILNTLPSKAFGYGECSLTWKIIPNRLLVKKWMEKLGAYYEVTPFVPKQWKTLRLATTVASLVAFQSWFQVPVRCFVGINAGEQERLLDKKGSFKPLEEKMFSVLFKSEYPLITWNLTKENEKALILSMGLPLPPKSSCKRCPNMTVQEILALPNEDYEMGCYIEENAEPFSGSIKGLGRGFSWRSLKTATPLELLAWQNRQESRKCGCVD